MGFPFPVSFVTCKVTHKQEEEPPTVFLVKRLFVSKAWTWDAFWGCFWIGKGQAGSQLSLIQPHCPRNYAFLIPHHFKHCFMMQKRVACTGTVQWKSCALPPQEEGNIYLWPVSINSSGAMRGELWLNILPFRWRAKPKWVLPRLNFFAKMT